MKLESYKSEFFSINRNRSIRSSATMDSTETRNSEENIETVENEDDVDFSEERELVGDSCSTKILDSEREPLDKYRIVYFLFYLFGITSLVPWNFLITANDVSI